MSVICKANSRFASFAHFMPCSLVFIEACRVGQDCRTFVRVALTPSRALRAFIDWMNEPLM